MASYKLTYFNVRARAEPVRYIFAQAGVPYEDKRIPHEEWPALKPSCPFETLLTLEEDGKVMSGSLPVARYLGEKFGLAGSNAFENGEVASVVDFTLDIQLRLFALKSESDEQRKADMMKENKETQFPKFYRILNKRITNGHSCFNKVTYADFYIYHITDYIAEVNPDAFDDYPNLVELRTTVATLPNIAKWIAERPETPF